MGEALALTECPERALSTGTEQEKVAPSPRSEVFQHLRAPESSPPFSGPLRGPLCIT